MNAQDYIKLVAHNQFEQPCQMHSKQCGLYCPHCNAFICDSCPDPHTSTGKILNTTGILAILRHTETATH